MKRLSIIFSVAALLTLGQTTVVKATPTFGDGGAALQGVLDGITVGGPSSVNVLTDHLSDPSDSVWETGGSGGSVSTIIVELAGFADNNTFGIYDNTDPTKTLEIFSGAASEGSQAIIGFLLDGSIILNFVDTGIDFDGNHFGFYLDTTANPEQTTVGLWYSETSLNSDGLDHMAAYQGTGDTIQIGGFAPGPWQSNEYILAWEDLDGGGDLDYTDFVVLVESITPLPEPSMLVVWGLLASFGLTFIGRHRRRSAS